MNESQSINPASKAPAASLLEIITAPWVTQCVYAVAKLGIADLLKDGPKGTDELAALTKSHEPSLYRIMRALASVGVFSELQPRCFELTPIAQHLRSDVPDSLRAYSILYGHDSHYRTWGEILHSVKTGKPAFDHAFNMNISSYFEQNPKAWKVFDDAMTSFTSQDISAITNTYDFSKMKMVIDIGGGNGMLLAAILKANPHLKGILFDLPEVIERAKHSEYLKTEIASNRCQLVPGCFLEEVPEGGDVYIMKHIIRGWNNKVSEYIMENCSYAMAENSKLLIIEHVVPPSNEPGFAKIMDILMLILGNGSERTVGEYNSLLQAAGFTQLRYINVLTTSLCIIESMRTQDLTLQSEQKTVSEVEYQAGQASATRETTFSGFIPRNQLTLGQIKEIKEKSTDIIVKLLEDGKYQEIARLAQAIDREQWYEAMQVINSIPGRELETQISMIKMNY